MTVNFLNLRKETDIQVQETQKVPNKKHPNRYTPTHIKIKMVKVKEKEDPKSSKRKTTCYVQGNPHKTIIFLNRNCRTERNSTRSV